MNSFGRRLTRRSYKRVLKMLKTDFDGWARHEIKILDLSPHESGLSRVLREAGYVVDRLTHGVPAREPLDLILYDGSSESEPEVDLVELVDTFQPGFQLIVINTPVAFRKPQSGNEINPENFRLYRMYPIPKWMDVFLGREWRRWVAKHPVLKIRTVRVV